MGQRKKRDFKKDPPGVVGKRKKEANTTPNEGSDDFQSRRTKQQGTSRPGKKLGGAKGNPCRKLKKEQTETNPETPFERHGKKKEPGQVGGPGNRDGGAFGDEKDGPRRRIVVSIERPIRKKKDNKRGEEKKRMSGGERGGKEKKTKTRGQGNNARRKKTPTHKTGHSSHRG